MYAIQQDAAVLTPAEIVKHVGDAGGFPINLIPALISAAATRMQGILPGKKQ